MSARATLRQFIDVESARLVLIHDVWDGYAHFAPVGAVYHLARGSRGGLSGEGRLSTGLHEERVVRVRIPAPMARRFLNAVAKAVVVPGAYTPLQEWTDDYPHIQVAFEVPSGAGRGIGLLFTESQGDYWAPWGACIGGALYTLPGKEVGRARKALETPLKRSVLDRMMR